MTTIISGDTGIDKIQNAIVTDDKLNLSANSQEIKDALNASGSAPIYSCRAWVNFNGSGTVAIRASGNVSSITDNGTGNYTVNFTTAMPDTNYSLTQWARKVNAFNDVAYGWFAYSTDTKSSSAVQIRTNYIATSGSSGADDSPEVNVMVFR